MLCSDPYLGPGFPVRCGQCGPCRIHLKRLWTGRLLLEWCTHDVSTFVTLTYSDKELPAGGHLVPEDLTKWLKRMRKRFGPFRYFAVGEYGDRTLRAHYHAVLFGLHVSKEDIEPVWGLGICSADEFNKARAAYICGYVVKKLTKKDNPLLEGRHPEFTRMSLRYGIGFGALQTIERLSEGGEAARLPIERFAKEGYFRFLGNKFPLGRYLSNKLRERNQINDKEQRRAQAQIEYRINSLDTEWRRGQSRKRKQHAQAAQAQFRRKHGI